MKEDNKPTTPSVVKKTPNPRLLKFFNDLGLVNEDSKATALFSRQSTAASRLDVGRFIRDQPCWSKPAIQNAMKPKKIILNYWQLLSDNSISPLLNLLFQQGFSIFYYDKNKKLVEVNSVEALDSTLKNRKNNLLRLLPNDELEKELSKTIDLKDYYLLDHVALKKLITATNSVELTDILSPHFLDEKTISVADNYTEEFLRLMDNPTFNQQFSKIHFACKVEGHYYDFKWNNNFTTAELKKLFGDRSLKSNLKSVLSPSSTKNLVELQDFADTFKEGNVIDCSFFPNLTALTLKNINDVLGLKKLNKLLQLKFLDRDGKEILDSKMKTLDITGASSLRSLELGLNSGVCFEGFEKLNDLEQSVNVDFYPNPPYDGPVKLNLKKIISTCLMRNHYYDSPQRWSLDEWRKIYSIQSLEEITLKNLQLIGDLRLAVFTNLRKLTFDCCTLIDYLLHLKSLPNCTELTELTIILNYENDTDPWTDLQNILEKLPKLAKLKLVGMGNSPLEPSAPGVNLDISRFPALVSLELKACWPITRISGLNNHPSIQKISLTRMNEIKELDISNNNNLKTLEIYSCFKLNEVKGIDSCQALLTLRSNQSCISLNKIAELNIPVVNLKTAALISEKTLEKENAGINTPVINLELAALICKKTLDNKSISDSMSKSSTLFNQVPSHTLSNLFSSKDNTVHNKLLAQLTHGKYTIPAPDKPLSIYFERPSIISNRPPTAADVSSEATHYSNQTAAPPSSAGAQNLSVDSDTYVSPDTKMSTTNIYVSANKKTYPSVSLYRQNIYSHIEVDAKGGLTLSAAIATDFKPYKFLMEKNNKENYFLGALPGPFFPGQEIMLPGLSSQDKMISIEESHLFDIAYSETLGIYKVTVKPDCPGGLTALKFTMEAQPNYFFTKINKIEEIPVDVSSQLLSADLKLRIKNCLNLTAPQLSERNPEQKDFFVFATKLKSAKNSLEILNLIITYCSGNEVKNAEISVKTGIGLDDLITQLIERKGACRHRSQMMLVLCHYFGIGARINNNTCHEFPEILLKTPSGNIWKGINLGGAQVNLIMEPNHYLEEVINVDEKNIPRNNPKDLKIVPPSETKAFHSDFLPNTAWLKTAASVGEIIQGFNKLTKPILIRTSPQQDAWSWNNAFRMDAKTNQIYLDSVDELQALFEIHQIKDNTIQIIDGPLKKLLQTGQGNIIINWSNFSANERAIYKCMMDTPPTLNGMQIPPNIRIIGLLDEKIEANDVFLSRCEEIRLPAHLTLPPLKYAKPAWLQPDQKTPIVDEKKAVISLYHDKDWQQELVETLTVDNDQLTSKEGLLIQCMRQGRPLVIKDAPFNDKNFQLFWHKLTSESAIYVNGTKIEAKPGFAIYLENETQKAMIPPENAKLDFKLDAKSQKIYISNANFSQLFSRQHVTAEGKIQSAAPGLLAEFKVGDQLVFLDPLMDDQANRLFDSIKSLKKLDPNCPDIHLYFKTLVEKSNTTIESDSKKSEHIISNDPQFIVDKNFAELDPGNIFYTNNENNWATLFEEIELLKNGGHISARRTEQALWRKLKNGETVVLCGDLTQEEYAAMRTLFYEPAHLYINGKREELRGTLKWISKPQLSFKTNDIPTRNIDVDLAVYRQHLEAEIDFDFSGTLDKLDQFLLTLGHLKSDNAWAPTLSQITFAKYKSLYFAIEQGYGKENPIKSVFQYYFKKGTEEYAFLNVAAKHSLTDLSRGNRTFNKSVRKEKLMRIMANNRNMIDFKNHFWRLANCFSGDALREMFPTLDLVNFSNNPPLLSDANILKFKTIIEIIVKNNNLLDSKDSKNEISIAIGLQDAKNVSDDKTPPLVFKNPGLTRFEKQQTRLVECLKDSKRNLIFLLGPAGTGKTFTAKRVVKEGLHIGEDNIKQWLESKATQPVLLLDEANLAETGKWEFLRGLNNNPPSITYQNKVYPLTEQHKVVVTGNPAYYPGRNWHSIFWEKSHVVWFAPFQPHFIKEKVREFLDEKDSPELQKISAVISAAYLHLSEHPHRTAEITLRDIENICARLQSTKLPIGRVILDEMAGVLATDHDRAHFKLFLEGLAGPIATQKLIHPPKDLTIPEEFHPVWEMLLDDLKMREDRVKHGSNVLPGRSGSNKLGLLLEGPSGIGKSTLLIHALQHLDCSLDSKDTQKKYYQITAGNKNVAEILLKAFHEGSIVILDELNLKQDIEILLNQLLSGSAPDGKAATKAGFTVLATQNPPTYLGTKNMSTALISRFHKILMQDIGLKSAEELLSKAGHPKPKIGAQAYREVREIHAHVNARNLFSAVNTYKKTQVDEKKEELKPIKKNNNTL